LNVSDVGLTTIGLVLMVELTVRVAALLVALPAAFVTTTLNSEPVSEVVVAGVV